MKYINRSRRAKYLSNILIGSAAAALLLVTIQVVFNYDIFISFAERYLTDDGNISHKAESVMRLYTAILYGLIIFLLFRFFDPVKTKIDSNSQKFVYTVSVLLIIIHYFFSDIKMIFAEDNLSESLTAILAVLSSGMFFIMARRGASGIEKTFLFFLSGMMFFFAMEEISWGQRILGIETPEFLKKINDQDEINIHNIFNSVAIMIYLIIFSLISGLFLFKDQIIKRMRGSLKKLIKFYPSDGYYYFGYLFLFLSGYALFKGAEIIEVIFSLFVFYYAIDLYKKQRSS